MTDAQFILMMFTMCGVVTGVSACISTVQRLCHYFKVSESNKDRSAWIALWISIIVFVSFGLYLNQGVPRLYNVNGYNIETVNHNGGFSKDGGFGRDEGYTTKRINVSLEIETGMYACRSFDHYDVRKIAGIKSTTAIVMIPRILALVKNPNVEWSDTVIINIPL
jgi:hypothetical protein